MLLVCGDKVRPNNINLGLPLWSIWRVTGTIGGLKLCPHSADAEAVKHLVAGLRFKPEDFTPQTRNVVGEWVDADSSAILPAAPASSVANQAGEPPREAKAVTKAREALAEAIKDAEKQNTELVKARCIEAGRKAALRAAQLEAKRKEELRKVEAEARAYEKSRALRVRLHADRCLGEATLELIAEVSRLHNGGPEAAAHASIANHADQLQPLARSYGYRIVKPSMVALVVRL